MSEKKAGRIAAFVILMVVIFIGASFWAYSYRNEILKLELKNYSDLGQFITAVIALLAAGLAGWQVLVQRELARQRTAFDFFFKTEMDEELLDIYRKSREVFRRLKLGAPLESFMCTDDYYLVRKYLNIHELMSVGIHQDVLDDDVCYAYWAGELIDDYESARWLIELIRNTPGEGTWYTYADIEKTYKRWLKRRDDAAHYRRLAT